MTSNVFRTFNCLCRFHNSWNPLVRRYYTTFRLRRNVFRSQLLLTQRKYYGNFIHRLRLTTSTTSTRMFSSEAPQSSTPPRFTKAYVHLKLLVYTRGKLTIKFQSELDELIYEKVAEDTLNELLSQFEELDAIINGESEQIEMDITFSVIKEFPSTLSSWRTSFIIILTLYFVVH